MRTVTEATLSDICLAKENVQKGLAKSKDVNDALTAELQAVVAAKEEAMTECQRLQKITQELESKVDLLTVVQGDLEAVDELQEELNLEQEKNTALQEEVRKNKEDYLKLRDELQQQRKNCTGLQHSVEVQETGLSQTNEKYEEMVKKLQMVSPFFRHFRNNLVGSEFSHSYYYWIEEVRSYFASFKRPWLAVS